MVWLLNDLQNPSFSLFLSGENDVLLCSVEEDVESLFVEVWWWELLNLVDSVEFLMGSTVAVPPLEGSFFADLLVLNLKALLGLVLDFMSVELDSLPVIELSVLKISISEDGWMADLDSLIHFVGEDHISVRFKSNGASSLIIDEDTVVG